MSASLADRLQRLGLADDSDWTDVVRAVKALPYGRASASGPDAVLSERRGTCSSKHELVRQLLDAGWPELEVAVVHRVYTVTPAAAEALFGSAVAATVPPAGLTDVHTYLRVTVPSGDVLVIDATLPDGFAWDGSSSMPLACGPGTDHPAGADPSWDKAALVAAHCDPTLREPFIAAIGASQGAGPPTRPGAVGEHT